MDTGTEQLEREVTRLNEQTLAAVELCFMTMDNIDDGYQGEGKFDDRTMKLLLER